MSKRIMNEVMCLAEDLRVQVYYQDANSMHIPRDSVLAEAFQTKYNRELIGSKLGQFYSDFPGTNANGSEVYAVESYFIWKKAYIDKLSNGGYHIRLKGIPLVSIQLVVERRLGGDPMKLYEYSFEGSRITFDLLETGVRFSLTPGGIMSKNKFTRNVCFR